MRRLAVSAATITSVCLVIIAIALLLLVNEVRFQGCVARIDSINATNATTKTPFSGPPDCSRVPFAAG